jgi:uncharacterized protein (TIGR00251 family)
LAGFFRETGSGLLLVVRVTPRAGQDRIDGAERRDDGQEVLRIRVRAVPDKGKANSAVIALVAKALGVPNSAVTLESGETARLKTLAVAGDPAVLAAAAAALRA